jgi:hypothetical protein
MFPVSLQFLPPEHGVPQLVVASDQEHRFAAINSAIPESIFQPPFRLTKVLVLPRSGRVQLGIEKTAQVAPTNGIGHTAAVRRAAATASSAVGSTRARSIGANAER